MSDQPPDGASTAGAPPPPPLATHRTPITIGQKVGGRYLARAILGVGGMGVVYHAVEEEIERDVALKFILVDPHMTPEEREAYYARFRKEAQALGSLPPHPNRVVLYQFGYDADADLHFMAMELVRGAQLSEVMQKRSLSIEQVVDYTRQMAMALEDVHASGLVHRDLKPENLIVTRSLLGDEQLKLIDFGIARAPVRMADVVDEDEDRELHGTVMYMAPELLVDGVQDARTDIYAIGVILFELVCGVGPFAHLLSPEEHEDVMGLVRHHVQSEPGPMKPCVGIGEVPEAFGRIILRCLAKEPDDRFANASELLAALDAMRRHAPSGAREEDDRRAEADLSRLADIRVLPEEGAGPPISTTAISGPMGWVAAADVAGDTRIWDFRTGDEIWTIPAPEEPGLSQAVRTRLSWSADGRLLALGDRMGRLWLCDVELRTKEIIPLADGAPRGITFDRSLGLMVVSTSAATIEVWDLPNRKLLTRITPELAGRRARPGDIRCIGLSPHRQYLVAGFVDGSLYLWNFLDKARSGALQGPPPVPGSYPVPDVETPAAVAYLGVSPDGRRIGVIRDGGFAEVWDANPRTLINRIALQEEESPCRLVFGPDSNQLLIAYNSGAIVILDANEGAELDALRIPRGTAVNIGYGKDEVPLASIARGSTVQVWDLLRRGRVQTVGPFRSPLLDVTVAPFGDTILTLASGGFIDRWDLLTGRHLGRLHTAVPTARSINKAPEQGRLLLCGSRDGLVAFEGIDVNGLGPIHRVPLPIPPPPEGRRVRSYSISRDQRFVALGYADGAVDVFAYHEESEPLSLGAGMPPVTATAFSPDNRFLAVAHADGQLQLWDLAATAIAWKETSGRMPIHFLAYTPSGRLLSVPRGPTIEVWNMESRRRVARMTGHEAPIRTMVHGLEGRLLLTASDDGTARLWDVAGLRALRVMRHPCPVTAATLGPDLRLLLTTAGPYLSVWRVSDAELLARFVYLGADRHGEVVQPRWVAWSPLGHYTASRREMDDLLFLHPGTQLPLSEAERAPLFDPRAVAARLVLDR